MTVETGPGATATEKHAARLLRTGLERTPAGESRAVLVGTLKSFPRLAEDLGDARVDALENLGPEGFIIVADSHHVIVASSGARGVLYGCGRLLRQALARGPMEPGEIRDRPVMPVRNIYFADHMGNWYEHAPEEEVHAYLDEMALWGYNELTTCLAVRPGETFFDAVARVHRLEAHARELGMRAGGVVQSNTSFNGPRPEWKATPGPIPGAYDVCPRRPGSEEFLVKDKAEYLPLLQPYDHITLWPYDGGGCYGEECRPWAATFLELSERITRAAIDGDAEVRVSAWFFERDMEGEDDALFRCLEAGPDWFHTTIAGTAEARRWVEHGRTFPAGHQVLLFPDTSMFDGVPWGGRGANAAPARFQRELTDTRSLLSGAVVYSEGRYDDINKVIWAGMLWNPERAADDIVAEYASAYFGAETAEPVARLVARVEEGMEGLPDGERWRRGVFHPEWDGAAAEIEAGLSEPVAQGWRWRLLRARTALEAQYAVAADAGAGEDARSEAAGHLRARYTNLQSQLNLHDERSLALFFNSPPAEAFPEAAALFAGV